MADNNNATKQNEVFNHYLELSKPTEEDFQRVFTEEELKELCLKHKCCVDMWRWNVVNDYRILFTNSGRYQRWSDRKRLLMLAKAVNKMKPSVLYDEQEIKRIRQEEWGLQLKENILSLNYWKRKKLNELEEQPMLYVSDSEEIGQEVQTEFTLNSESMNIAEICTQSQAAAPLKEANSIRPSIEKAPTSPALSSQSVEDNMMDVMQKKYLLDEDSEDSDDTVLLNPYQTQQKESIAVIVETAETLQSEEVVPEIENMYGVNTMSMSIDSQYSMQRSEDVVPHSYDNFKNVIPLTSTQSQSHESEEIRVV